MSRDLKSSSSQQFEFDDVAQLLGSQLLSSRKASTNQTAAGVHIENLNKDEKLNGRTKCCISKSNLYLLQWFIMVLINI